MIVRNKKVPDYEIEATTHDDILVAYRALEEVAKLHKGASAQVLKGNQANGSLALPAAGEASTLPPESESAPTLGPRSRMTLKKALSVMTSVLWSYDVAVLRKIKAERMRRKDIEEMLSGHSFNKCEPRWAKVAKQAGGEPKDFVDTDKLGEGMGKETWYVAGPMLAAIPDEDLERLETELKQKEEEAEQKKKRVSAK